MVEGDLVISTRVLRAAENAVIEQALTEFWNILFADTGDNVGDNSEAEAKLAIIERLLGEGA